MHSRAKTPESPSPLEWAEEGYRCLRNAPARVILLYYIGSVPFWIGFLFFWAEMTRGTLPARIAVESAFVVVLLYFWMKAFQAVFLHRLREVLMDEPPQRLGIRRMARALPAQMAIHSAGLFVVVLSAVVIFPLVAVSAFLQNVLAAAFREDGIRDLLANAARRARYEALSLYLCAAVLVFFGMFVFGNFLFGVYYLPEIGRILTGWETPFLEGGWTFANTTVLTAVFAMTCLVLDPLWKTVCLLRCFHYDSRATGDDLRVALRRVRRGAVGVAAAFAVVFGALFCVPASIEAGEPESEAAVEAGTIDGVLLDREIHTVLEDRRYAWWTYHAEDEEAERGFIGTTVELAARWVTGLLEWLNEVVEWIILRILDWVFQTDREGAAEIGEPRDWTGFLRAALFGLAVILCAVVLLMAWRMWNRRRRGSRDEGDGETAGVAPDLEDEEIRADSRTLDEWAGIAEELRAKGDLRLALRALYLAGLSALAKEGVLTAEPGKSNREYQTELDRRAHDQPERLDAFAEHCRIYERSWYGMYPVDEDLYARFETNLETLRNRVQVAGS